MNFSDGSKEDAWRAPRRVLLPLSTGIIILPQQSAQITARSQLDLFCPDRLLIKNAGHWNIDDGRDPEDSSSSDPENSSRVAFSPIEAGRRSGAAFSPVEWCRLPAQEVPCGDRIVLGITYIGPNACGEPFEAALFGWEGRRPSAIDHTEDEDRDRVSERARSPEVSAGEEVKLPLKIAAPTLFVDRLTIADAKSWVVNDVRVGGASIFVQSGDVPGEMFSADGPSSMTLGALTTKDLVEVVATYIGDASAASLAIELSGTTRPPRERRASTLFLPMSTGVHILPFTNAHITARPQVKLVPPGSTFLPERVVLADPGNWIINDVKVGVLSQFAQSGDVPGMAFSSHGVGCHVRFNPVQALQDFVLIATYVGDRDAGAPFYCGVQGRLMQRPTPR